MTFLKMKLLIYKIDLDFFLFIHIKLLQIYKMNRPMWVNNPIDLLEKNQDKINWQLLSGNPNAISLLEKNIDKVSSYWLSLNLNAITIF